MWSTRWLNDMDPLPLVGYASGVDATGYPRSWRPTTFRTGLGDGSRSGVPLEASVFGWELGNLSAMAAILVPTLGLHRWH
jgi:hypothetical protein